MREVEAILSSYESAKKAGLACVLATVVHVEGSSYRRAGARMLVDENGLMTGAISGGCLEGDALRKALHALYQNQIKLITYDTSDEADAVIGAQLGCNGIIQVLFEPLDYDNPQNAVSLLKKATEEEGMMVIGTFFNLQKAKVQGGTQLLVDDRLTLTFEVPDHRMITQLKADCARVLKEGSSLFREYILGKEKEYVFLEAFLPSIKLVIVGAGNDAQVLAQMADMLGWKIVVTDGRPSHANLSRFVGACEIIVTRPEKILEEVAPDARTAFVLMTHNYNYDLAVLKLLLGISAVPYIGILGPRKKYDRMLNDLNKEDINPSQEDFDRIFAPIGLALGAETSAEIALSILSEIQAVFTKTNGSSLKLKPGPIHLKKNNDFKTAVIE
jgi:xanthine dehydrogenase accessory factor